jgi:hypothetical protein
LRTMYSQFMHLIMLLAAAPGLMNLDLMWTNERNLG